VRANESFRDKVLYEASFTALSFPRVVRRAPRSDVLVCVIPSLAAAVAAAALVRSLRGVSGAPRLVLWVQDLVLVAASSVEGVGRTAERLLRALRRVEAATARAADRVVVCSPGFHDYFVRAGVAGSKVETIPNWVKTAWIVPGERANGGPTRFLYAGNLGYTQGFGTLIEAARIAGPGIEVEIVGDGNAATQVRALAAGVPNVSIREPVPNSEFPRLLADADAHVVLQRRISAGANLPSKIASYLASGRAIVASIDAGTPAADLLEASGGAVLVEPEEPDELARAMALLHEQPDVRAELGTRGRAFAERELARDVILPRLERAFLG
jgi:colanic acid biosynthesis glycosyl transferase WcaI